MKRHLILASLLLGMASPVFSAFTVFLIAAPGSARSKLGSQAIVDAPIRSNLSTLTRFLVTANRSVASAVLGAPAVFTVTNSSDNGPGSLRNAIDLANINGGADTIDFASGLGTINVGSITGLPLPDITEAVTIDSGAQRVELNGTAAGIFANGLSILAPGVIVRGLAINRFASEGILVDAANCIIQNNFIGTDPTGTIARPNGGDGVFVSSSGNMIGGTGSADRNLISGNTGIGIEITGDTNTILGNFIGTDVTGTIARPNAGAGVFVFGNGNLIGGTGSADRNLISGNTGNGIEITGNNNTIQGNFIGTNVSGSAPLGNSGSGVRTGTNNNLIGGTSAGAGNTIAFNSASGVDIADGNNNGVLGNSIFSNAGLGIDLNNDGAITPNDPCDPDTGANGLQNFPILNSATRVGANTAITGTLDSTGTTAFRIEFFSSPACDPSGNGEGQTFIGSTVINPPSVGCSYVINVTLPVSVPAGNVITATATDPSNNTSEFSPCVTVVCTLTCSDLFVATPPDATSCGVVVTFSPDPSAACSGVSCTPPSGTSFPVGTTTVTCTAFNAQSCSFTVNVADGTPPALSCSTGVSVPLPPGQLTAVVNYPAPTVSDNCSAVSLVCTPPSGSTFPAGATLVTCTATDEAQNFTRCFFFVNVIDSQPPVITCPANISVVPGPGQTSVVVNYPPPTATDNLPGVSVTCMPPSGSSFPLGSTRVTCTATDSGGNRSSCSFTVGVGGPQIKVTIPGNKTAVEFAASPTRKPPKSKNSPCSFFTVENVGFSPLVLTLNSIARTGADVDSGRITDPNDARYFSLSLVNSDQSQSPLEIGGAITLQAGQAHNICARFAALIPALSGKTTGLAAANVLPSTLTSKVVFQQNAAANISIPLLARVSTGLVLVNVSNPRNLPQVIFTRNGNEITVSYGIFDSNLDVTRARYELVDNNGQVRAGPFDIDLSGPIQSLALVKGQSFSVEQRFTGASSNPEVTGVRLTVFDGETSVGASSSTSQRSIAVASVQLMNRARRVTLYPPEVKLGPQVP